MGKRTKKLIFLIVFLANALIFLLITNLLKDAIPPESFASGDLYKLKIGVIFLSILGLIFPWLIKSKILPLQFRKGWLPDRLNPEYMILFLGYLFLVSPVIYGLLLFLLGLPISEFYYFLLATIVDAILWGMYNMREA